MTGNLYSIVPVEAIRDRRLSLEQLRVLIALLSFRSKSANLVWPSRAQIAERCGIHIANISSATSALERFGWLEKEGKGGHSKATRYTLVVPDLENSTTLADSATAADSATVADSATRPLAESARGMRVADSATRKEVNQELTNRRDQGSSPACSQASPDREKQITSIPDCPHHEIIALYAKHLPTLPRPRVWDGERAKNLRARWRWVLTSKGEDGEPLATDTASGLRYFEGFFHFVAQSDFLTGRSDKWHGCDLEWLVKAGNFAKVIEGKYENRETTA